MMAHDSGAKSPSPQRRRHEPASKRAKSSGLSQDDPAVAKAGVAPTSPASRPPPDLAAGSHLGGLQLTCPRDNPAFAEAPAGCPPERPPEAEPSDPHVHSLPGRSALSHATGCVDNGTSLDQGVGSRSSEVQEANSRKRKAAEGVLGMDEGPPLVGGAFGGGGLAGVPKGRKGAGQMSAEAVAAGKRLLEACERHEESLVERQAFFEVDVATLMQPQQAVGRQVRVLWPQEEAWFGGKVESYCAATGQHKVKYEDGDEEDLWLAEGVESVRILLPLGENFVAPAPADLEQLSEKLMQQGRLLGENTETKEKAKAVQACSLRLKHQAQSSAEASISASPSAGRHAANMATHRWGDVVWAKSKGYPFWPSLVSTRGEAAGHGVKGIRPTSICVQAFGEYSWTAVAPRDVVGLPEGVSRGLHDRHTKAFKRGVFEAAVYLQDGELPDEMVHNNNDDGFSSASEDEEEPLALPRGQQLPGSFRVSKKLTVNSLGCVNFLHPGFHNAKHIWPLGYQATSLVASPASQDTEAEHVCRIVAASDGSGPRFRITCGEVTVEGRNPQSVWQKLQGSSALAAKPSRQEGLQMFGLKNRAVCQRILQLPGAERCEQYCGWPEDGKSKGKGDAEGPRNFPRLTEAEQRERSRAEVEMQQLPEDVQCVPYQGLEGARCDACGLETESAEDILLQCDGPCGRFVHQYCCWELKRANGVWHCPLCRTGCCHPPACALCPVKGGSMMPTHCGRWVHTACALWIPEAVVSTDDSNTLVPKVDIDDIPKSRKKLVCSICRQGYGACIQCGEGTCFASFHPLCARGAGLAMVEEHDEHFLAGEVPAAATAAHRKRKGGSSRGEGTQMGNGTKMVCYCSKHRPQPQASHEPRGELPAAGPLLTEALQRASEFVAASEEALEEAGSSRAVPFDHALRRGLRAPEAMAASLAKRTFLRALAYEVRRCPPRQGRMPPVSRCLQPASSGGLISAVETGWGGREAGASGRGSLGKATPVLSISQRYWRMKATESARVALGKSKIHGWGALAKVAHKKGDLVIEYGGEVVRAVVADLRERRLYDSLVGAGTYVFALDDVCIDATRAGNVAHLLNHSCEPNCYSRPIEAAATPEGGPPVEHVVIVAKVDICAGEELTYDYRFHSNELLPCNCGAARCRGWVNVAGKASEPHVLIPRDQLKPLIPREL